MAKIESLCRHNGYPNKLIHRTKHKVLFTNTTRHTGSTEYIAEEHKRFTKE